MTWNKSRFTAFCEKLPEDVRETVHPEIIREIYINSASSRRAAERCAEYAQTIRAEMNEAVAEAVAAEIETETASNQMTAFFESQTAQETQPEAERRYLTSWDYNAALIFGELETIVKNHGGQLATTWDYETPPAWLTERKLFLISNRSLSRIVHEKTELLERLENRGRTEAAQAVRDELEQYARIDNEPRPSYYGDYRYICFALDGYYYYYQMDGNPLFEFWFTKAPILTGDKMNRNRYMSEDKKHWWDDCFLSHTCTPEDRREAANHIYTMLVLANESTAYRDKNRRPLTNVFYIKGEK